MDAMKKISFAYPFIFIIILVFHLVLFFLKISQSFEPSKDPIKRVIQIKVIDEVKVKKQVVESVDSDNREVSKKAFLSDKNRTFDHQRKAKKIDQFSKSSSGSPKKSIRFSDLGSLVNHDPFKEVAQGQSKNLEKKAHSSNDYLPDIPEGELTQLNTVEFKYYGFYHRIKQKLEQFWERSLQEKAENLAKSGRHIAINEELLTALEVTLNAQGEVISIIIRTTSGVKEFDDAAVESFNEAGPFPNPPKDLVVNGKVKIEWGFVVRS
jgi:TonB family protein